MKLPHPWQNLLFLGLLFGSQAGCASILNPHPPVDVESLSLTERRALMPHTVADPDPASLADWSFGPDKSAQRSEGPRGQPR